MNLCIDIGNSSVKLGLFDGQEQLSFIRRESLDADLLGEVAGGCSVDECIVSSTVGYPDELKNLVGRFFPGVFYFRGDSPMPLRNLYHTPATLGPDRLAAAVGAYYKTKNDTLVIDSGTAITYDLVSAAGEYLGGNISPGVEMRFRALHEFTAKLPLIDEDGLVPECGYDTETAIRSGVITGIKYEIEQNILNRILKYPNLSVFYTGGTHINFDKSIKKRIFADKYIVLEGLNIVLDYLKGRR
ncbi:MAG: type III pantothenate kinase [Bacteroidaceae bacterium]|nr:type III pantothenate kinase [Bacteroidaceae bacterium]